MNEMQQGKGKIGDLEVTYKRYYKRSGNGYKQVLELEPRAFIHMRRYVLETEDGQSITFLYKFGRIIEE